MIAAHDVTDNGGALAVAGRAAQTGFVHGVEDSAMYGLKTIPDVRQSPVDDNAHAITQITIFHDVFDAAQLDAAGMSGIQHVIGGYLAAATLLHRQFGDYLVIRLLLFVHIICPDPLRTWR